MWYSLIFYLPICLYHGLKLHVYVTVLIMHHFHKYDLANVCIVLSDDFSFYSIDLYKKSSNIDRKLAQSCLIYLFTSIIISEMSSLYSIEFAVFGREAFLWYKQRSEEHKIKISSLLLMLFSFLLFCIPFGFRDGLGILRYRLRAKIH